MSMESTAEPFLSVVAPAYNEEATIATVVREWDVILRRLDLDAEIVVCNDGSTDRTQEILEQLATEIPRLHLLHGEVNRGYGHTLSRAIAASRGKFLVTIDSDGQFDLSDIAAFLPKVRDAEWDAVTGHRIRKSDTILRVLADRCLNLLVRGLFGTKLRDTNCALKLVRADLLRALRLEANGYPLPTEVVVKLEACGTRLADCPVRHLDRQGGESKLRLFSTGWRMLLFLFYLRLRLSLFRAGVLREF